MINLKVHTEYYFRRAYGPLSQIIEQTRAPALGIADDNSYGHVQFHKLATKAGINPILGIEFAVSETLDRIKQPYNAMTVIAQDAAALARLYELASVATEHFYYTPRIDYELLAQGAADGGWIVLSGTSPIIAKLKRIRGLYIEANPSGAGWNRKAHAVAESLRTGVVACSNNQYPRPDDQDAYNIIVPRKQNMQIGPRFILTEDEARMAMPMLRDDAFDISDSLAKEVCIKFAHADPVKFPATASLGELCRAGFARRGMPEPPKEYAERLAQELRMIEEKGFEDYFLLVADLVNHAKQSMLVGPSRGSSAGSIVCWLLGITEVDPLKYGLIFERFVDINRQDLPDIDIDFPDFKREEVFEYLIGKYGAENVARIATVSKFKPKSSIGDAAKALGVPLWETNDLKNSIVERSSGDARAALCVEDAFTSTDVGKAFIAKYPQMRVVQKIEGHSRHSGVHAAGVIVANERMTNYGTIDRHNGGILQLDKKDAESVGLLKIDALGLRTLSVLETAASLAGLPIHHYYDLPLDDDAAFAVFGDMRLAGIFQFEGYALQSLTRQMGVTRFDDIVAITSLARPGPLHCGGATMFIQRRTGKEPVKYIHEVTRPQTEETFGTVVYQEQVMQIGREVGQLSWEDVSSLRKAMSKSLGDEFFNQYWDKFKVGAANNGVDEVTARKIWDNVCTFGSWAFNKSHAVSYALISYWCAWMKAHHPLEFAVAQLQNNNGEPQCKKILRELIRAGYKFVPFDREHSDVSWSVGADGALYGGLINIKGIGDKKAATIKTKLVRGLPLAPGEKKLIEEAETPYNNLFEAEEKFKQYYDNPELANVKSTNISFIDDITEDEGDYVFIGKIVELNLRDLNEYASVVKRKGRRINGNSEFINMMLEDDTSSIICTIDRFKYLRYGRPLVEQGAVGHWFLVKGKVRQGWRKIYVEKMREIT